MLLTVNVLLMKNDKGREDTLEIIRKKKHGNKEVQEVVFALQAIPVNHAINYDLHMRQTFNHCYYLCFAKQKIRKCVWINKNRSDLFSFFV